MDIESIYIQPGNQHRMPI